MTYAREAMCCRFSLLFLIIGIHVGLLGCAQATLSHNPHVAQAAKLANQQKWPEAIAELTQGIQQDPKDSVAYDWRGLAYYNRGEYEKSVADYSRAIELTGGQDPNLFYGRGRSRLGLGTTEAALDDLSHAIALGNNHANVYMARGRAYNQKGMKAEAIADFTRAIERDATMTAAYGRRGIALVEIEQYRQGLEDLDRYVPTQPTDHLARRAQGYALFKLGQSERARDIVQRMIEDDPRLATNFSGDRWADLYDRDKRRAMGRQALATASQAEQSGDIAAAFREYERGRGWSMGYTAEDRKDWESIWQGLIRLYPKLSIKPVPPEGVRRYWIQGEALAKDRSYEKALEAYGKALSVAPWWPPVWFNRAFLLAEQGQTRAAIDAMKNYLALDPNAADARAAQDKIYEWEAKTK